MKGEYIYKVGERIQMFGDPRDPFHCMFGRIIEVGKHSTYLVRLEDGTQVYTDAGIIITADEPSPKR